MEKSLVDILKDGMGNIRLWGYSRALDFQDYKNWHCESDRSLNTREQIMDNCRRETAKDHGSELTILLAGGVDGRHIIKTIARSWRHKPRPIHFYIIESQAPTILRELLLLLAFMDSNSFDCGIEEHSEMLLEMYGNLFLRERTSLLLQELVTKLVKCITDPSKVGSFGLANGQNILDLSFLKYRERDDLEFACNYWRDSQREFKADLMLEERHRRYYDRRYDSRKNVADWDYHMKLQPKASIVDWSEFSRWRMHGNAFESREQAYTVPNKSMASVDELYSSSEGIKVPKWGYFSEIVSGPFPGYGIDTENKSMLAKANDKHTSLSRNVAVFNVASYLYEWQNGDLYNCSKVAEDVLCPRRAPEISLVNGDNLHLHVLPSNLLVLTEPPNKKFRDLAAKRFDIIYLGTDYVQFIDRMEPLLVEGGVVVAETGKFNLGFTEDALTAYNKKILELSGRVYKAPNGLIAGDWSDVDHSLSLLQKGKTEQDTLLRMEHFIFSRTRDLINEIVSPIEIDFAVLQSSNSALKNKAAESPAVKKLDSAIAVDEMNVKGSSTEVVDSTTASADKTIPVPISSELRTKLNNSSIENRMEAMNVSDSVHIPEIKITEIEDTSHFDGFENLTPREARVAKRNFELHKRPE